MRAQIGETLQTSDLQMIGAACAVLALHEGVPLSDIDMSVRIQNSHLPTPSKL